MFPPVLPMETMRLRHTAERIVRLGNIHPSQPSVIAGVAQAAGCAWPRPMALGSTMRLRHTSELIVGLRNVPQSQPSAVAGVTQAAECQLITGHTHGCEKAGGTLPRCNDGCGNPTPLFLITTAPCKLYPSRHQPNSAVEGTRRQGLPSSQASCRRAPHLCVRPFSQMIRAGAIIKNLAAWLELLVKFGFIFGAAVAIAVGQFLLGGILAALAIGVILRLKRGRKST